MREGGRAEPITPEEVVASKELAEERFAEQAALTVGIDGNHVERRREQQAVLVGRDQRHRLAVGGDRRGLAGREQLAHLAVDLRGDLVGTREVGIEGFAEAHVHRALW